MKARQELVSSRFIQLVRWSIVLALGGLLLSMAVGQFGISNYMQLIDNKEELLAEKIRLVLENQNLEERIQGLSESSEAQQRYLKEQFGYVSHGEYLYRFGGPGLEIRSKKSGGRVAGNEHHPIGKPKI